MPIPVPASEEHNYVAAPKGPHQGVLVRIQDKGKQPNKFENNQLEHRVRFYWELNRYMDDGRPFIFSKEFKLSRFYKPSTGAMSGLVEMLSHWLDLSPNEIPELLWSDLEVLIGLNARLNIKHDAKNDGGVRDGLQSIEPWHGPLLAPRPNQDGWAPPAQDTQTFLGRVGYTGAPVLNNAPTGQQPYYPQHPQQRQYNGQNAAPPTATATAFASSDLIAEMRAAALNAYGPEASAMLKAVSPGRKPYPSEAQAFINKAMADMAQQSQAHQPSLPGGGYDPDFDDSDPFADE